MRTQANPSSVTIPPNSPRVRIDFAEVQRRLHPARVTHADDDRHRLFVVQQNGLIRIIKNGAVLSAPFLNPSSLIHCGGEDGLLGLAFEPSYGTTGRFYVYIPISPVTR